MVIPWKVWEIKKELRILKSEEKRSKPWRAWECDWRAWERFWNKLIEELEKLIVKLILGLWKRENGYKSKA